MKGLERLLHPLPVGEYLTSLGTVPLLITGRPPEHDRGLLDQRALEAILANYGPAPKHAVRLSKVGGDPESIWFEDEQPRLDRVRAALQDGYSLNVNDLADRHLPIRALSAELCADLGATIRFNAFLTPARSRAFPLHFDPHEVLILQLEGTKRWRVFGPRMEAPTPHTAGDRTIDPADAGQPLIDRTLEAGDLLTIPCGFGHEAYCEDTASLHVTIAIHRPTWADVLTRLVTDTEKLAPALRRALPPGAVFGARGAETQAGYAQAIDALADHLEAALCSLGVETLADHPTMHAPALPTDATPPLQADTLLSRHIDVFGLIYQRGQRAGIQWPGTRVECPLKGREALEFIRDRKDAFSVAELPGLDEGERIQLATRLLREGVLTMTDSSA